MKCVLIDGKGIHEIARDEVDKHTKILAQKFLFCRLPQGDFLVIGVSDGNMTGHTDFWNRFIGQYGRGAELIGAGDLSMGKVTGWESRGLNIVTRDDLRPSIREALIAIGFAADITG